MTDTSLANAGWNAKPISSSLFDKVKGKLTNTDKSFHRDDPDVVKALT